MSFGPMMSNTYTQLGVKHGERRQFTAPRSVVFQKNVRWKPGKNPASSCISQASKQLSHAGGGRLLLCRAQVMKNNKGYSSVRQLFAEFGWCLFHSDIFRPQRIAKSTRMITVVGIINDELMT